MILKWIQINSKKPGFGRENQLRTWWHLKDCHSIQTWFPFIFCCSKKQYIHCKTMFTCWVSLFCNRFTFGPRAQATLVLYDRTPLSFLDFEIHLPIVTFEALLFQRVMDLLPWSKGLLIKILVSFKVVEGYCKLLFC
jgi:hypothetical protein